VFTTASSRRGHTARLREALGEIGVLPYYTFSVKGYMENSFNFATNARAMQEQIEEKAAGAVGPEHHHRLADLPAEPARIPERLRALREELGVPFLATDRNVLNLPGVGKSLTYRVIGITRYGRRILEFDHDGTRRHSPIIARMGRIVIIESKSISEYLAQLAQIGEDPGDYASLWGYSLGETEPRLPLYEYPGHDFAVTEEMTNLAVEALTGEDPAGDDLTGGGPAVDSPGPASAPGPARATSPSAAPGPPAGRGPDDSAMDTGMPTR
jgi:lysine 2,3-aminomutase